MQANGPGWNDEWCIQDDDASGIQDEHYTTQNVHIQYTVSSVLE